MSPHTNTTAAAIRVSRTTSRTYHRASIFQRLVLELSIIAIALSANAKNMPTINDAIAISADLMRKRFIRR
jgi:hypothetical protein